MRGQVLSHYLSLTGACPPALSLVLDPLMLPPGEGFSGVMFSVHFITPATPTTTAAAGSHGGGVGVGAGNTGGVWSVVCWLMVGMVTAV